MKKSLQNKEMKAFTKQFQNTPCGLLDDVWLKPFRPELKRRRDYVQNRWDKLKNTPDWHEEFGLHHLTDGSWLFREWLPGVKDVWLKGGFSSTTRVTASGKAASLQAHSTTATATECKSHGQRAAKATACQLAPRMSFGRKRR